MPRFTIGFSTFDRHQINFCHIGAFMTRKMGDLPVGSRGGGATGQQFLVGTGGTVVPQAMVGHRAAGVVILYLRAYSTDILLKAVDKEVEWAGRLQRTACGPGACVSASFGV